MNEPNAAAPAPPEATPSLARLPRWLAGLQAGLVSGLPTQIIVLATLSLLMRAPLTDATGHASLAVFAAVGLADTVLIATLIVFFLQQSGEDARTVLFGAERAWPAVRRGLLLVPVAFVGVTVSVLGLRLVAPSLQTVATNPLAAYLTSPGRALLFLAVAVLAGGVREELQRAFILHRFDQRLGGIRVGLCLFTLAFAAQHFEQGADVAIAIGLLALWWGSVYARRRSIWLPMANHAGFNGLQVLQAMAAKAMGAP